MLDLVRTSNVIVGMTKLSQAVLGGIQYSGDLSGSSRKHALKIVRLNFVDADMESVRTLCMNRVKVPKVSDCLSAARTKVIIDLVESLDASKHACLTRLESFDA
jgi:hypothetical protein